MSYDAKAICQAVSHLWNSGDASAAQPYYSSDVVRRAPNHEPLTGFTAITQYVDELRTAFPDAHLAIHEFVEGAEVLAVHWTFTGTHKGTYNGMPATGHHFDTSGVTWVRVRDGKIASEDVFFDNLGVVQSLGGLPAAASA